MTALDKAFIDEAARPEESRSFAFAQDDTTKYKVLSSKKTGAIKLLGAR